MSQEKETAASLMPLVDKESAVVIIKPDAIEDMLHEEIVCDLLLHMAKSDINVVEMNVVTLTKEILTEHYMGRGQDYILNCGKKMEDALIELKRPVEKDAETLGREILGIHVDKLEGMKAFVMLLEGVDVVEKLKEIKGSTDPTKSAKETLRGKYSSNMSIIDAYDNKTPLKNRVHIPDSKEEAIRDVLVFYPKRSKTLVKA